MTSDLNIISLLDEFAVQAKDADGNPAPSAETFARLSEAFSTIEREALVHGSLMEFSERDMRMVLSARGSLIGTELLSFLKSSGALKEGDDKALEEIQSFAIRLVQIVAQTMNTAYCLGARAMAMQAEDILPPGLFISDDKMSELVEDARLNPEGGDLHKFGIDPSPGVVTLLDHPVAREFYVASVFNFSTICLNQVLNFARSIPGESEEVQDELNKQLYTGMQQLLMAIFAAGFIIGETRNGASPIAEENGK